MLKWLLCKINIKIPLSRQDVMTFFVRLDLQLPRLYGEAQVENCVSREYLLNCVLTIVQLY